MLVGREVMLGSLTIAVPRIARLKNGKGREFCVEIFLILSVLRKSELV